MLRGRLTAVCASAEGHTIVRISAAHIIQQAESTKLAPDVFLVVLIELPNCI